MASEYIFHIFSTSVRENVKADPAELSVRVPLVVSTLPKKKKKKKTRNNSEDEMPVHTYSLTISFFSGYGLDSSK